MKSTARLFRCAKTPEKDDAAIWFASVATATAAGIPRNIRRYYKEKSFLPENFYKGSEYDLNIFRWNKEINNHIDKMSFGYIECFPHQFRIKKKSVLINSQFMS